MKNYDVSILEKKNYVFSRKYKGEYRIVNSVGLGTNSINLYFTKEWLEGYINEKIEINQEFLDLIKVNKCKCGKRRNTCKICEGNGICEHGKHRYRCIECKGGSICEHNQNKYTCKECDGTGICEHKKVKIRCVDCNGSQVCIHKKLKNICKDCGGSQICEHGIRKQGCKKCHGASICEHDKYRTSCKECGGGSICEHKKLRYKCKECGGKGICEHGIQKQSCKQCHGSSICEHNRIKFTCRECGGKGICIHNKIKTQCKECGGAKICEHNKQKNSCKECLGSSICEHNRTKYTCRECGGKGICIHDRIRAQCKECGGTKICEHNKQKNHCGECKGSQICVTPLCETSKNKKYGDYCAFCFFSNPENADHPRMINYKSKEKTVADFIIKTFSEITWIADKTVIDGCSKKRPDLFADFGDHIIIIEIDEDKHSHYTCENKRLCQISQDVNMRPITFIRFNPDSYVQNKIKTLSPWKKDRYGKIEIINPQEWTERLAVLKKTVEDVINQPSFKIIDIIHLFF